MNDALYFVAIVPPLAIRKEITAFKKIMAAQFGSSHAMNAPPHITLHMPFRLKNKKIDKLVDLITRLNSSFLSFTIELEDFDFFEPRVVFVDVLPNKQLDELQQKVIKTFRKELKLDNGNYKDQGFHPHVTIGFRDLRKPMFYLAKEAFSTKSYRSHFRVSRIELLKHEEGKWNLLPLGQE